MKNTLFESIINVKGIGPKIKKQLEEKNIFNKIDLLLNLPTGSIDRRFCPKLDQLEVGKISTIFITPIKYNFPRIKNLPNRINCIDEFGKIDLVFFNSRENYIKQMLPLNEEVVVSGKVTLYKNKFQITNPDYIRSTDKGSDLKKIMARYASISGVSDKTLQKIYSEESKNIDQFNEWHDNNFIKKMSWLSWGESLKRLHNPQTTEDINKNSIFFERLAYDEVFSNLLIFNEIKKRIKKIKKEPKIIADDILKKIKSNLPFKLTASQEKSLNDILKDLSSTKKMMRVLQGDVGSGKTIVSLIVSYLCLKNNYQVAIMAPTEILAEQHYKLFCKILSFENFNIKILTGKTKISEQKIIRENLKNGKINLILGTHSLFQEKINFQKLGLIIIDEQHKFGVRQRINLSQKGTTNTDVILMTATPIPRTLILTNYGDMDISTIDEKPFSNNNIETLIKPANKIDEIIKFVKSRLDINDQVYWVCPIIEESEKIKATAAVKRFEYLKSKLNYPIGLIHGSLKKEEKEKTMNDFINGKLKMIIATTVIEVGIDNPNANTIIIENSERFGLAQLHQLRGRIGRSGKDAFCLLIYSSSISETGKRRLKIMKESNDGFYISEEDLKLRGFGDIIGYKQSGEKDFLIADPLYHSHLFELAKNNIEKENKYNITDYEILLKIFKKDKVLNIIDTG
jgi:ATP-dependent DNA helicase RecG